MPSTSPRVADKSHAVGRAQGQAFGRAPRAPCARPNSACARGGASRGRSAARAGATRQGFFNAFFCCCWLDRLRAGERA